MKKELNVQIILFVLEIILISLAIFGLLTNERISSIIAASTMLCASIIGIITSPAFSVKVFITTFEISKGSQIYKKIRRTRFLTIFIFIYWFNLIKNSDNAKESIGDSK